MKMRLVAPGLMVLSFAATASAHRLDEYLQATTISLERRRVQAEIRLTPGVGVFPLIMAAIDTDEDGSLSSDEQRAYAERVIGDLSLAVDGDRLSLFLISTTFPATDEMKEGRGSIRIDAAADVPRQRPERQLAFENRHQRSIAAYLVNCLAPQDPDIRITAQARNYEQSLYQLNYAQGGGRAGGWLSDGRGWLGCVAMLLAVRLAVLWRRRMNSPRAIESDTVTTL